MIALLAIACWAFLAMLAGLVTGTPELRTFGAGGAAVFFVAAYLVDRYAAREESWTDHLVDESDWDWPRRDAA